MNTLVKALIIVVLVLSLAYVVISITLISHQVNWYHRSIALQSELQRETGATNERITALTGRIDALHATLSERENLLTTVQQDRDKLSQQLQAAGAQIGQLQGERDQFAQRYTQLEQSSQADREALAELRNNYRALQEDYVQAKDQNLKLQDQLAGLENRLSLATRRGDELYRQNKEYEERSARLEHELRSYRTVFGLLPESLRGPELAKPPITGQVIATSQDPAVPLVVLGVGKKEGVEPGFSFVVYRGDKFLGKVIAEEVLDDMTAARIDPRFKQADAAITIGDNVTTRLAY